MIIENLMNIKDRVIPVINTMIDAKIKIYVKKIKSKLLKVIENQ